MYESSGSVEYNQDQTPLMNQGSFILGVIEILCSVILVLEEKTGKEIPEQEGFKESK